MFFLATKLHNFSRITFGYVNYLPFCGSFLRFFVGIALLDGNESYKNQIVGTI